MSPDSRIDCARAPVVALGGQEFFVPMLALRQARVVVPGLLKLLPRLNEIQTRIAAGDSMAAALLGQDDVDLMIDVVHCGLTRAYPDFSRDDLLDQQAGFAELVAALTVIAAQTGLFTAADPQTPGE
ncbi:hypothetical protein [Rhodoblastus sp.]|jgi:hypothetical protein|uniref:hypothetical protein n=1 Tax=Rhodoblastus sp. TaxID=1962975 RepID=UPI00260DBA61|nr:hypothetical protein [Rhodoblastus sp.]